MSGAWSPPSDAAVAADRLAREALAARDQALWPFLAALPSPAVVLEPRGTVLYANGALCDITGRRPDETIGRDWAATFQHPDDTAANRGLVPAPAGGWPAGREIVAPLVLRDGRMHLVRWVTLPLPGLPGGAGATAFVGDDLTADQERKARLAQLAAAVEGTRDGVLVTDLTGRILYVNPAFESATGHTARDVLGQNPRFLNSGHHPPETFAALWWTITHGQTWRGELINLRADVSLIVVETTIVPVRDARGVTIAYVGLQHDVTPLRELRASLDESKRQRERLAGALERIGLKESVDDTCRDIATVLSELPGVLIGGVALADDATTVRLVATASRTIDTSGPWLQPGGPAAERVCRPDAAPWVETVASMTDPVRAGALRAAGVEAVYYVPVRQDGHALGALVLGGKDRQGADLVAQDLPIGEIAAVLRAVLGPTASPQATRRRLRERTRALAADGASTPVFQPIRDMVTKRIAGFEALTRFADGTPPHRAFADAEACGMSHDLELATLRSAIAAAAALPREAWLSLNVSASLVSAGGEVAQLLRSARREVIVEITARDEAADYAAARRALDAISKTIRVAVDDAGRGDFRHLVEARPDFVKLGVGLVRGIEQDVARQAVVAGLRQFSQASGGGLIAEGIETPEEQAMLLKLGVPFGQGYHLGRPEPAEAFARDAGARARP